MNRERPEVTESRVSSELGHIIDSFEDAWQQGRRPVIDDFLPNGEAIRRLALCELVHVELERRLKAGEPARVEAYLERYPELSESIAKVLELIAAEFELRRREASFEEYLNRFPQYREQLQKLSDSSPNDSVWRRELPQRPLAGGSAGRAKFHADRNLLFGILALQMDFITRDALIAGMNAWVLAKNESLGQILLQQGGIAADSLALLEALVQKHLALHDDDPEKSLAALSSVKSVRHELEQVGDADVQASLAHVPNAARPQDDDPFATRVTVGTPTSSGLRFRILRPHAEGGLGQVYVAHDEELHREVALKEIRERHADDRQSRMRFVLEAEITGGLEHPGIVPVYGLGTYADGRPFYAMRFIKGDSLKDAIEHFHRKTCEVSKTSKVSGELTVEFHKLLRRFIDVCNAIAYAHSRGVLHRDLKPGNIMLGQYGETLVVDWGLAKPLGRQEGTSLAEEQPLQPTSASGSAETQPGTAIGTPHFMSPEQAAGRSDLLGPTTDVYSLGATLFCVLTGKVPIADRDIGVVLQKVQRGDFPRPRLMKPDVPPPLEAICVKAMALEPANRYSSARALADDLERWLADEGVQAYQEPLRVRMGRWARRHQTVVSATVASVLVALLVGGGIAFLWQRQRAEDEAEQARQEGQTRQAIESALLEVDRFQKSAKWEEARVTLGQADSRLIHGKPEDLRRRLKSARDDLELAAKLHAISGKTASEMRLGLSFGTTDQEYANAFRVAGLGTVGDPPSTVSKRLRASAVRETLVASLDFWAMSSRKAAERAWVLAVLRETDPDPWRNRARDPAKWFDTASLAQLAREAPLDQWTPQLLVVVGARLAFPEFLRRELLGKFINVDNSQPLGNGQALLRRAQQRHPDDFWINFALGFAMEDVNLQEALGYYRAALALRPATPALLNNIGEMLHDLKRHLEAIQAYREAISLEPQYAYARNNLGIVLRELGRLEEAKAEFAQAAALGYQPATPEVRRCEEMIALRTRLPDILKGKHKPGSVAEYLALAALCNLPFERRHAAAAGFYAEAFAVQPNLASDLTMSYRYDAACSAALAGCGLSSDAAGLDNTGKAKLRVQALEWLKADLALWSGEHDSWMGSLPPARRKRENMLRHWRSDRDLLSVRYAGVLATMPATERDGWVKLWGEVENLLKKTAGHTPARR
jgi:serine/threonine protein kinase